MATNAVDHAKYLYGCFAKQDIASLLAGLAENVTWIQHAHPSEVPLGGEYKGRDGVANFFKGIPAAVHLSRFEPQEFHGQGDFCVVLGSETGKVVSNGKEFTNGRWAHIWWFKDGKVTRFEEFLDSTLPMAFRAYAGAAAHEPHRQQLAPSHGGVSHVNCILRFYEEMNRDPEGFYDSLEKHQIINTAKFQFHMRNLNKTFDYASWKATHSQMRKSFTDMVQAVCEVIEQGSRINVRLMVTGLHSGDLDVAGVKIPASKKRFQATASVTFHFGCDGKITEMSVISTLMDALRAASLQ